MVNEFNLTALFRSAFGTARGNLFNKDLRQNKEFDKSKIEEETLREGTPFDDLPAIDTSEDEFGTLRDVLGSNLPDGRAVFMPMKIGDLLLPNEPTISFVRKKDIKSTSLIGVQRKGTVKELIGFKDTQILIRGIAINYGNTKVYPEKMVKDINDLFLRPEALEIQCALTSLLGIYRIVIQDLKLPEMIGIQHAQAYEFKCITDEEFVLEL